MLCDSEGRVPGGKGEEKRNLNYGNAGNILVSERWTNSSVSECIARLWPSLYQASTLMGEKEYIVSAGVGFFALSQRRSAANI